MPPLFVFAAEARGPRSEDAELHCSYDVDGGGGIYVPPPDAQESTGLNDERAASARLTIKS